MKLLALATDYDGTLAEDGVTAPPTVAGLQRWKASGRKLVMVTGRPLPELRQVFAHLDLFDRVVVENGGLLYNPETDHERLLAREASSDLIARLRSQGVDNLEVGRSIIGSSIEHEATMRQTVLDMALELDIILNTDAVMILQRGTDKASGLRAALDELSLTEYQVAGTGDAENDVVFLRRCGLAVAVANALPQVKAIADTVTVNERGAGVVEFIEAVLQADQTSG